MDTTRDEAEATPTKQFFVDMLTRDILLVDAILDLVDNCIDGALRLAGDAGVDYSKHMISINVSEDRFSISDNCGGISREIAKKYAFRMGREVGDDRDSSAETIGMYGVGMKRAIFKMGKQASVKTMHLDDCFEVCINPDWLSHREWTPLPINSIEGDDRLEVPGTEIEITELRTGVSHEFRDDSFLGELKRSISEHFTIFLEKGLEITLNDQKVDHIEIKILASEKEDSPAPYIFCKDIDGVSVRMAIGLNSPKIVDEDDDSENNFGGDRDSRGAGWTIFCNDRAVRVGDKSRLTGWGNGGPFYHYQHSIITGIVEFRSKVADELPVTTTKRNLDTSSDVWMQTFSEMTKAMKIWARHTNRWKNRKREDQSSYWKGTRPASLSEVIGMISKRTGVVTRGDKIEYNPEKNKVLPMPADGKPDEQRIVFLRPRDEVRRVSEFLFEDPDAKPSDVGQECFVRTLKDVEKGDG